MKVETLFWFKVSKVIIGLWIQQSLNLIRSFNEREEALRRSCVACNRTRESRRKSQRETEREWEKETEREKRERKRKRRYGVNSASFDWPLGAERLIFGWRKKIVCVAVFRERINKIWCRSKLNKSCFLGLQSRVGKLYQDVVVKNQKNYWPSVMGEK